MALLPADGRPDSAAAEVLARLGRLHPKTIDLSLDRIRGLLDDLGQPHRRLPPVVHVAGTNGKGSAIAYMRAGLEAAGRRVHVYSSPHLVRFAERIRLAGRLIDDERLLDCLQRCEDINGGRPLTFFEATTAAAFLAFAETPADVLLLETGLGGRLDATNVIERPALTAITSLALDHQDYLGPELTGIAREKAGILKPGAACVLAPQSAELIPVLREAADKVGCPLLEHGRDWSSSTDDGLNWRDGARCLRLPLPSLPGPHQAVNAGLALTCLNRLPGMAASDADLFQAVTGVDWPARLQRLHDGPLAALLPSDSELWLDGGHNQAAAAMLAQGLGALPPRPLHLVLGMLSNRDPAAFLQPFAGLAADIWTVPVTGEPNAFTATDLARAAGQPATPTTDIASALSRIADTHGPAPRVLICGSLYLAGDVLRQNGWVPR